MATQCGQPDARTGFDFTLFEGGDFTIDIVVSSGLTGSTSQTFTMTDLEASADVFTFEVLSATWNYGPNGEHPGTDYVYPECIGEGIGPGPVLLSPGEELELLNQLLAYAVSIHSAKYPLYPIGQGWLGNFDENCHCSNLAYRFQPILQNLIAEQVKSNRIHFQHYDVAGVYTQGVSGYVGLDLTQHIYFGLVDRGSGQLEYFADPWRSHQYTSWQPTAQDPNSTTGQQVVPWGIGNTPRCNS